MRDTITSVPVPLMETAACSQVSGLESTQSLSTQIFSAKYFHAAVPGTFHVFLITARSSTDVLVELDRLMQASKRTCLL